MMSSRKQAMVLVLAAQPGETSQIRLDEEARSIEQKLMEGRARERLRLKTYWAVQPDDVMRALSEHHPAVVHFSGHGSRGGKLVLESPQGGRHYVSGEALTSLFRVMGKGVKVVVLNSCFSASQAEEVTRYVDVAIGMRKGIGVDAAIQFSAAFYRALGFGKSVQQAFEEGLVGIEMFDLSESQIPVLYQREGVDAGNLSILSETLASESVGGRTSDITLDDFDAGGEVIIEGIKVGKPGDKSRIDARNGKTKKDLTITGIGG